MTTDDTTTDTTDVDARLLAGLAGLATEAPAGLPDAVFARWVRVPSGLGDVYAAATAHGVQFLRPAGDAGLAGFTAAYRARFARPLVAAPRPPAGLLPALRGRPGRGPALDLTALTGFERAVLDATRRIPAGQARPYGWVAREAGSPGAVRAVGSVLARNPVPLLVPCHRVVRADGALGGYLFGAPEKERLLRAEGMDVDGVADLARRGVRYLASDTTTVVCFPTCRDARRITPRHRHGFGTLDEAVRAGFRPCRTCRPAGAA
ncbi:methylated-DNA--[protein]-cysteine S-methyltransferase [Pseudonocardia humida]|uniref:Methylated-DNA--[protein]-cysteine S-methyltransferase n=1 Tax=Pseudonocardia humida TaxID=2800819 RepID=A0ABT0ZTP2_9PSEU|nr:methylated-DNA--[protein]-cysteine S-methyltransferase [Pseudonocardia humida]MCO1654065.1 methylated-DNA--[protein]-cysteine S-methyltransferase [Pseudonocardia humida]